jgi:hypothetical protein
MMAKDLPNNHHPSDLPTVVSPRLVELCFQTAGVWELGVDSRMGLPQHVRELGLYRAPTSADGRFYAVVTRNEVQGTFDAEVLDTKGDCYLRLTGYQTVALPNAVDTKPLKALQEIMSGDALLVA